MIDVLPATTVDEGAIFAVLRCCCAVDVVPMWGVSAPPGPVMTLSRSPNVPETSPKNHFPVCSGSSQRAYASRGRY